MGQTDKRGLTAKHSKFEIFVTKFLLVFPEHLKRLSSKTANI